MPYAAFQYLPLAVELTNNELALSVVGVLATLVGHHFVLRKYIREAAGVKETSRTEIIKQPLRVQFAQEFVTRDDHSRFSVELERRVLSLETDIKDVREKMEEDKQDIIAAGEVRMVKIHDRVNLAIERIGELKGQVQEISKRGGAS